MINRVRAGLKAGTSGLAFALALSGHALAEDPVRFYQAFATLVGIHNLRGGRLCFESQFGL